MDITVAVKTKTLLNIQEGNLLRTKLEGIQSEDVLVPGTSPSVWQYFV